MSQDTNNINLSVSFSSAEPLNVSVAADSIANTTTQWGDIVGTLSDQTDLQTVLTAQQTAIESVDTKVATNTTNIAANTKKIASNTTTINTHTERIADSRAIIDDHTAQLETLTTSVSGIEWRYQLNLKLSQGDDKYNLPEAFVFESSDFTNLLVEAFKEYLNSEVGDPDDDTRDCTTILKNVAGRKIFPSLVGSRYIAAETSALSNTYNLHFKPWEICFYDKITKYSDTLNGYIVPTLLIKFDRDTIEYFNKLFSYAPVGMELNTLDACWDYIDDNGDIIGRTSF